MTDLKRTTRAQQKDSIASFLKALEARSKLLAFFFGVSFVAILLGLAVCFPRPTVFQHTVFRIALALAAAGVAGVVPGMIRLKVQPSAMLLIHAGGALAVFVIVYLIAPAGLDPEPTPNVPAKEPTPSHKPLKVGSVDAVERDVYVLNFVPHRPVRGFRLSNVGDIPVHVALVGFPEQHFFISLAHDDPFIQGHSYKDVDIVLTCNVPLEDVPVFEIKDSTGGIARIKIRLDAGWHRHFAGMLEKLLAKEAQGSGPTELVQAALQMSASEYKELAIPLQEALAGHLLASAGLPEVAAVAYAKAEKKVPKVVKQLVAASSTLDVITALANEHEVQHNFDQANYWRSIAERLVLLATEATPSATAFHPRVAVLSQSLSEPILSPFSYAPKAGNLMRDELVWVPGGCFQMGSASDEEGRFDDEGPMQEVCVEGLWLGKHEVTQAQWQKVMGSNPSQFKGANLPVEMVSWNDVQEFIAKLNADGESDWTWRLPTEAEWEHACRAGGYGPYCGGSNLDAVAWHEGNSGGSTHSVGTKQANGIGLHDMSGNVWEWCSDWHGADYYQDQHDDNPQGSESGSDRVVRGGSWFFNGRNCRSAYRSKPVSRNWDIGFRLARDRKVQSAWRDVTMPRGSRRTQP